MIVHFFYRPYIYITSYYVLKITLVVIRGHFWSLVVTRGQLVVTRGQLVVNSWSLVVIRGHSWSLVCTFRQDLNFASEQLIVGTCNTFSNKVRFQNMGDSDYWTKEVEK